MGNGRIAADWRCRVNLADKYRPREWSDVIGQEKAVAQFQSLEARGQLLGNALCITGKSGTGKSSLAMLAASKCTDEWHTFREPGRKITVAVLREWLQSVRYSGPWAFIVEEFHGLSKPIVEELLVELDPIPPNSIWLFTTTRDNLETLFEDQLDGPPFLSRCKRVKLTERDLQAKFAARAREIAQAENLDGQPLERYLRLAKECNSNFRAMLQAIDAGELLS